jgi:hypothetical protein
MSVAGKTSAGGRGTRIATSQKDLINAENIHEELNDLRILYGPNGRRNHGLVPWEEMGRLTEMIQKLTRQRVAASTMNRRMEDQLERLEKVTSRLEKESAKEEERVNSWARRVSEELTTPFRSHPVSSVGVAPPVRNLCEEFEVKVFIKGEEEVERIMAATTEDIVRWARGIDVDDTLPARKDIEAMKRRPGLLVFQVKTEDSKKILEENDFWTKEVSPNASLRGASFGVVVHGIRVEGMPKDIEKEGAKTLTKFNKGIHPEVTIEKVEWLTKDSEQKRYASLVVRVASAEVANKLIDEGVCHEADIKTTQFYDPGCRVHQCLKCQGYGHKTYGCKNKQRCAYCALDHRSEHCSHKQARDMWKCGACRGTHRAFDPQCHKRQAEKERMKRATKQRPLYHAVRGQRGLGTVAPMTFTRTSTSLGSLVDNSLKRKQGRPTNGSRLLSAAATPGNTILDRLSKKPRSNGPESTPATSTSVSSSPEDLSNEASASQALKRTLNIYEYEL